jgi:phage tail sheath protein FI
METSDADVQSLNRVGLNVIARHASGRSMLHGSVTLGRGREADRQFALLPARRLCLSISNAIERATRWAVFESDGNRIAERVGAQVNDYMTSLAAAGAFAEPHFTVQCDTGSGSLARRRSLNVTVLLTFRPHGCDEPVSLTLQQSASGCRVATTAFAPVAAECA